jgi:predicted ATP-grasp superfamily ATP-dependent carboligase
MARSLAGASRYSRAQHQVPDPLTNRIGFLQAVEELVRRWQIEILLPVTDPSLLAILGERDRFQGALVPFPPHLSFREISDKERVLEQASMLGIATPSQIVLAHPEDRSRLDSADLRFPLVLKPTRSVGEANGQPLKVGVEHVADRSTLVAALQRLPAQAYPLLVQQRVVGPGVGLFLLLWQGEMLAVFSHRRIREKPPSGGVSVYRESIPADPSLVERSRALLERFHWRGVAMVEYKLDAATGTPYLMEVNGRFWGSLQLAVDAGVDFPVLLVEAALGRAPRPVTDYRAGVRSRWWWGDVDHLLARLRRSRAQLALPPEAPGRWRAVRDFARLWRPGDRNEIFRIQDPFPLLRESIDWFARR